MRSNRVNKGISSQNFDDFDNDLMKEARSLMWVFVKKGDQNPILIAYNSVMWPTEMTTRQKVDLKNRPTKTKVTLLYENREIECSLSVVLNKNAMSDAMEFIHQKMVDADGQLSDVSYYGSQPSPSPARSSLKSFSTSPGKPKSKKSITFVPNTYEPSISLNATVEENSSENYCTQKDIRTPTESSGHFENDISDIIDVVDEKLRKIIAVQEEHARKITLENNRFRTRFAELYKKQRGDQTPVPVVSSSADPLMFGELDLMSLTPIGGPSAFGRLLAATIFGADDKCELIHQRLGVKIRKNNCRTSANAEKEALFRECVGRFYCSDTANALKEAVRGANQYGTDMKTRYVKATENDENVDPNNVSV